MLLQALYKTLGGQPLRVVGPRRCSLQGTDRRWQSCVVVGFGFPGLFLELWGSLDPFGFQVQDLRAAGRGFASGLWGFKSRFNSSGD